MTHTKQIKYWKSKFRLLKNWKVLYDWRSKYKAQIFITPNKNKAILCSYDNKNIPKDYFVHELLHVAMRDVARTKKYSKRKEKEEILIQDICRLMRL